MVDALEGQLDVTWNVFDVLWMVKVAGFSADKYHLYGHITYWFVCAFGAGEVLGLAYTKSGSLLLSGAPFPHCFDHAFRS